MVKIPIFQSTPSTEGDKANYGYTEAPQHFNPRPLRRATAQFIDAHNAQVISIHALYGGRLYGFQSTKNIRKISIHALYGGRQKTYAKDHIYLDFNPRPLRRATFLLTTCFRCFSISIHALYGGRHLRQELISAITQISIHALYGGRL